MTHDPTSPLEGAADGDASTIGTAVIDADAADAAGPTATTDAVSGQPDMEYAMVDATIVKVHRHGQGAGLKARP